MDLTEARAIVERAREQVTEAQKLNLLLVLEGLRAAYAGADSLNKLGPIAVEEPYKVHVIAQRLESAVRISRSISAALHVVNGSAQRVVAILVEAQGTLGPVVAEGWPLAASIVGELGQAVEIVSGVVEADKILPLAGETADFRIGQAIGKMGELIGMLS